MNKIKSSKASISQKLVLFVLVSIVLWMLTKLSKEYEKTVFFPVAYTNIAKDKLFDSEPISELPIHIKGTGFKLISSQLFPSKLKLDASSLIYKNGQTYFLLLSQQRINIQKQMRAGLSVDHFIKDSVFLKLGTLSRKTVPVKLDSNINFDAGYDIDGDVQIDPVSIELIGPNSVLDTISDVKTIFFSALNVNSDIEESLDIITFDESSNVTSEVSQVQVNIKVSKYTEGNLQVPVTVKNVPDDTTVNIYPHLVEVKYKVSLEDFSSVNPSSFEIICDFKDSQEKGITYLIPKIQSSPSNVKNVKLSVNKIDFTLEKK